VFEKLNELRTLMDAVARKTVDKPTHDMLALMKSALQEIDRLEGEVGKAWADGDQMAWREHASKAMASLVMMAGYRRDKDGTLMPAIEGVDDADVAVRSIAMLADKYGDAMVERDRLKRKGAST
jgi:hypothetical protein